MIDFRILDARVTPEHLGFIPDFMSEHDPRGAVEQIDANYQHGGGWTDMRVGEGGWRLIDGGRVIKYPGDTPMHAYAVAHLHKRGEGTGELIYIYESAFVCVIQPDGSARVARID